MSQSERWRPRGAWPSAALVGLGLFLGCRHAPVPGDEPGRAPGAVQIELFPMLLQDQGLQVLLPEAAPTWKIEHNGSEHPHAGVQRALKSLGVLVRVVHSTSWRHEPPAIVLTYLAVIDPLPAWPQGYALARVSRSELVRGTATEAPPSIGVEAVLNHGLEHLAWLVREDAAVREALGPGWAAALAPYAPKPFLELNR